ncbi:polysaccharide pyruvyl transferase family protein, partial [Aliarcobacter butzleri]|uniref:polysaccharide pyruvyl transferase family protein n=1 Tax=Aliarcobacter butzleri TaxID=28197 RepID=UPI0021B1B5AE
MKKAILINDTSFEGHHGCTYVVDAIFENLADRGFQIIYTVPVGVNWMNDLKVIELLPTVDLIIVNGEGTLHHSQSRGLDIVKITGFAKLHKIVCVLINSSYEKNNSEISDYVRDFDMIYVRDKQSLIELKEKNIESEVVPDLSFYSSKPQIISKDNKLMGYSDSVFPNITVELFKKSQKEEAEFCPILSYDSPMIESRYIPYAVNSSEQYYKTISSYSYLITGRYHTVCLALQAKVPFYAIPSNSNKIEALLNDIGLNTDRIKLIENGFDFGIPFEFSNIELEKISEYIQISRKKITNMFDNICNITKQLTLDLSILSRYIKPNDRVLDCYCGIAKRARIISMFYPINSITCFDINEFELEYAKAKTKEQYTSFIYINTIAELCDKDNKYDLILFPFVKIQFIDIFTIYKILTPGGRLVLFGNQTEYINNKHSFEKLFINEFSQNFGLDIVNIFMKSPIDNQDITYEERVFKNLAKTNHPSLNYKRSYFNPWLQHTMVTYGLRMNNKNELMRLCNTVLSDTRYSVLEQSAAITVKAYQILEDDNLNQKNIELILQQIVQIISSLNNDEPEIIRWFVSLSFVKAKLLQKIGNFEQAILAFNECNTRDIFLFGVHLATKVTESLFHAGELSYTIGDLHSCKKYWYEGLEFGRKLQKVTLEDILINPEFPNLFDHGDGVREYTLAWDWIARCANGIHLLKRDGELRDGSYDSLQKSFLYQYQQVTHDMINATSELIQVRTDLSDRTQRLEIAEKELIDRTQRLEIAEKELIDRTQRLEIAEKEL